MSNLATQTAACQYCGVTIEKFGTSVWYTADIADATEASFCESSSSAYGWHEPYAVDVHTCGICQALSREDELQKTH